MCPQSPVPCYIFQKSNNSPIVYYSYCFVKKLILYSITTELFYFQDLYRIKFYTHLPKQIEFKEIFYLSFIKFYILVIAHKINYLQFLTKLVKSKVYCLLFELASINC